MVLFWADAGWTAGDPTATPRATFAKAVSALQRAVGTAWEIQAVASLPRALGGLGVGILNAADDLAGGGAAVAQGARQAARKASQQAAQPEAGQKVYRVYGGEPMDADAWMAGQFSGPWGRYWTPIDPRRIRDYRNIAGLPIENKGRFLLVGELIDPRGIRVERAAPIGSNPGGGLVEYQIPNPRRQVRILQVIGLNPPF